MPYTHLRKSDFGLLCAAVLFALALFFVPHIFRHTAGSAYCEITINGRTDSYSIQENRTLSLNGNGYSLTVSIADGTVRVTSADCPDLVCVHTGEISHTGEVIVCIPAECVIRIVGENAGEADYIAG